MSDSVITAAAGSAARVRRAIEPLHAMVYFAPDALDALTSAGLRPGSMAYFASRSAPMGAVGPAVTAATFYNFNPAMIERHIPRAWTLATPDAILDARLRGAEAALTRLLGAGLDDEVAELADLARTATAVLTPEGRPLYAAHAGLPWPSSSIGALWHGVSLLREYRGDGHVAALVRSGLSGLDALLTHTFTGRGFTVTMAQKSRGWSEEQWRDAIAGLNTRGLLSGTDLTPAGQALRDQVEADTDAADTASWSHLGAEGTARMIELGKVLSRRIVGNGAFPDGTFA